MEALVLENLGEFGPSKQLLVLWQLHGDMQEPNKVRQ